jgi:hypothetical protein
LLGIGFAIGAPARAVKINGEAIAAVAKKANGRTENLVLLDMVDMNIVME